MVKYLDCLLTLKKIQLKKNVYCSFLRNVRYFYEIYIRHFSADLIFFNKLSIDIFFQEFFPSVEGSWASVGGRLIIKSERGFAQITIATGRLLRRTQIESVCGQGLACLF